MKTYNIFGIGAALVDTEIKVSDQDLVQMEVQKGVMTLVDQSRQDQLLGHLQDHLTTAEHASGGSAANSIIAASLMGSPTYFACKVAHDTDGDIYLGDLQQAGVACDERAARGIGTTGKCLVLITPDAERSMNTFLGISASLSLDQLNKSALVNSEWLYLEAYQAPSPTGMEACLTALDIARENNVKIALSFSDPGMVEHFRSQVDALVGDHVDLIFCNTEEALCFAKTESVDDAIALLKTKAKQFVMTRGAEGALAFDGATMHKISAHPVDALDTNGAGDMFAGAFLYALSRGEDFATAGRFASIAAGTIVSQYGPRLSASQCTKLRRAFFGDS